MQTDAKEEVVYLYLDDIIPNRFQPREVFDERALKELAVSIKEHGVIQPIIVRNVNGKYEIIAGERRYKAAAMAGLTKIPAIVRNLDDKESSKVALLENLQRRNLNPMEEARTYQKILELDQMTQEELARTMGKSQSAVANKIRLLRLSDEVQEALLKEQISERHARALLNIADPKKQKEMLKKVIANKMTVRQLEAEINNIEEKKETKGVAMNNQQTINSTNFVNSSPLTPTAKLPEQQEEIGKITIAPPEGSNFDNANPPRFINYGEINDDDDDDDSDTPIIGGTNPNSTEITPNISEIKANAVDINSVRSPAPTGDLDSLLHITNAPTQQNKEFKYLTPAEAIVKEDANKPAPTAEDYFKTPSLIPVNLPDTVQTSNTKSVSVNEIEENHEKANMLNNSNYSEETQVQHDSRFEKDKLNNTNINKTLFEPSIMKENNNKKNEKFNIQKSIDMIRSLVEELKAHGVAADIDEMNFSKSYQIIVKLDKTAEQ